MAFVLVVEQIFDRRNAATHCGTFADDRDMVNTRLTYCDTSCDGLPVRIPSDTALKSALGRTLASCDFISYRIDHVAAPHSLA
jgi:hypothetical protein